jgi:hypothetical protein
MKPLELAIININGENLRLEVHAENLPCKKLGSYITYCTNYDYSGCEHICKYSKIKEEEKK